MKTKSVGLSLLLGTIIWIGYSGAIAVAQDASTTTTTTTQQVAPTPPPPPATTVQTTVTTTVAAKQLYIRKAESGGLHDGDKIYVRPSGKVYDSDGDLVGHVTNLGGSDIRGVPMRDEFKIKSPDGTLIASTRPSSAYDSDRKVTILPQDKPDSASTTTTTTRQTTVTQ